MASIRARLRLLSFRKILVQSLSSILSGAASAARRRLAPGVRTVGSRASLLSAILLLAVAAPTAAAQYEPDDEPILPDALSSLDVEMSSRYVHQWRDDGGDKRHRHRLVGHPRQVPRPADL